MKDYERHTNGRAGSELNYVVHNVGLFKRRNWVDIVYDTIESLGRAGGEVYCGDAQEVMLGQVLQATQCCLDIGMLGASGGRLLWVTTDGRLLMDYGRHTDGPAGSEVN